MHTNRSRRRGGFTLVELLTVIFIIGVLIAILVPSLNAARRSAKTASSSAIVRSIGTGLEMFKNDHDKDHQRTNGYPPSFVHPILLDRNGVPVFTAQDGAEGRYPYIQQKPRVYGAHLLPLMLMGADLNGYIRPGSVPEDRRNKPWEWYLPDPTTGQLLDRSTLYLDPSKTRMTATENLPGFAPTDSSLFPNWDQMKQLPVLLDAFDTPILYYASNRGASTRNLVEDVHKLDNNYADEGGPPFYFHQDNRGFTGYAMNPSGSDLREGWNFGKGGDHRIAAIGHLLTADDLHDFPETFAHWVHDEGAHEATENQSGNAPKPLRAKNADSFILVSPGADQLYGTPDDVTNF